MHRALMKVKAVMSNVSLSRSGKELLPIAVFAGILVFATRNLFMGSMIAVPDISPFPEGIGPLAERLASDWTRLEYGISQPIEISFVIRIFFLLVSGGDAVLAQRLYMIAPLFLSFLTMYYLAGRLVKSTMARFLASLFYASNPFAIAIFSTATGYLYVQSILPLITYVMMRLPISEGRERLRLALVFSAALAAGYSFGRHITLFAVPIVGYGLVTSLRLKPSVRVLKSIAWVLLAVFLGAFLVFLSHYPELRFMLGYVVPGGGRLASSGLGVDFSAYSNLPFPVPLTIFTLQPPKIFGWGIDPGIMLVSLVFPLLAFSGLLTRWSGEQERICIFSSILTILIAAFNYLSWLGLTLPLVQTFRFLVAIRNEVLPSLFLSFAYALLISLFISKLAGRLNQLKHLKYRMPLKAFTAILILALLILPTLPFYRGDIGLNEMHGSSGSYGPYIPNKYYEISGWLSERRAEEGPFRTLWFPHTFTDVDIKTIYLGADLAFLLGGSEKFFHPTFVKFQNAIFKATFEEGWVTRFGSLVAPLAVKYIILDMDSKQKGDPIIAESFVFGDPRSMLSILQRQKDLKLVLNGTGYLIFENSEYIPRRSTFEKIAYIYMGSRSYDEAVITLNLLLDVPGFTLRDHLLVFSDEQPEGEMEIISLSSVLVMPNLANATKSLNLSKDKALIIISTVSQFGVFEGRLGYKVPLMLDRNGTYRVAFWFPHPLTISLNGTHFEPRRLAETGWYESQTVRLPAGEQELVLMEPEADLQAVGHWVFSDVFDKLVHDNSGFDNDAVINGPYLDDTTTGQALRFNEGDYVEVPGFWRTNLSAPLSVEAWIRPDIRGTAGTIISVSESFLFRVHEKTVELQLFGKRDGSADFFELTTKDVLTGEMQQVAFTYDGKQAKIYVDGELVAGKDWESSLNPSVQTLYIGIREPEFPQGYAGNMLKIAVFRGAIDEKTMKERYTTAESRLAAVEDLKVVVFKVDGNLSISDIWSRVGQGENGRRFAFLSEPYNDGWDAYIDGKKGSHFSGFMGMNAFYHEGEFQSMEVVYEGQIWRNLEIFAMGAAWFLVLGIIVLSYRRKLNASPS